MAAVMKHAEQFTMDICNAGAVDAIAKAFADGAVPHGCDVFPLVARAGAPGVALTAAELTARAAQLTSVVFGRGAAAAAVVDAANGSLTLGRSRRCVENEEREGLSLSAFACPTYTAFAVELKNLGGEPIVDGGRVVDERERGHGARESVAAAFLQVTCVGGCARG